MSEKLHAIAQLFGGKFIFTVVTAGVFAYGVVSKVLNGEQTYGIIMLVVAFYFSKTTQGGTGNGTSNNSGSGAPAGGGQ